MIRIVLAVDGSEHSERAARLAGEMSRCTRARVYVVHVAQEHIPVADGISHEYARIEGRYVTHAQILEAVEVNGVHTAAHIVREAGGRVESEEVVIGRAAEEIVDYANRIDADAIIMGRRGLGEVEGVFMGSVSHRVGQLTGKTLITTE